MSEQECVGDDGTAFVRISAVFEDQGEDLAWHLTGSDGSVRSGIISWDEDMEWYPPLDFDLPIGHFRIDLAFADTLEPVAETSFDMAGCVAVDLGCHELTFRNPATNPPARVEYAPSSDDWLPPLPGDGEGTVVLAPGESRSVDYRHWEMSGRAYVPADSPPHLANAGFYQSESVEQHCGPTMTGGVIRCSADGRSVVDARFLTPDDRPARFQLYAWWSDRVRSSGPVGPDGRIELKLKPGFYALLGFARGDPLPYDQAAFEVPPCVTAELRRDAVRFANPTDEKIVLRYRGAGNGPTIIRLGPGRARTVAVEPGRLTWRASSYETGESWTVEPGRGTLRVPASRPEQHRRSEETLVNTGSTGGIFGPVGALATVLGVVLLLVAGRRRAE